MSCKILHVYSVEEYETMGNGRKYDISKALDTDPHDRRIRKVEAHSVRGRVRYNVRK